MSYFISNICTALSINNLWEVFGFLLPIISIGVIFGLGIYLIRACYVIITFGPDAWNDRAR